MKNAIRILLSFVCGIFTETMMVLIANSLYVKKFVLWSFAASLIIALSLFAGICVVVRELQEARDARKAKEAKNKTTESAVKA